MSSPATSVICQAGLPIVLILLLAAPAAAQTTDPAPSSPAADSISGPNRKAERRRRARTERQDQAAGNAKDRQDAGQPDEAAAGNSRQQRAQRMAQFLRRMDADGNGVLEKSEVPERLQNRWDQIDSNGDGQLDRQEIGRLIRQLGQCAGKKPNDAMPGDASSPDSTPQVPRLRDNRKLRLQDQNPAERPGNGSVEPVHPGKKTVDRAI